MTRSGAASRRTGPAARAGFVLGVALGGFFDGIMLHQVLQWHHLLSLVPGEDLRRMETQIFADGAFHVLMWVIAVVGLWLLWRARDDLATDTTGRRLLVSVLLGFAVWNTVDVVGFHWLLHIHRIRVDVPAGERLGWDLLWLALFGLVPFAAAWLIARRGGGDPAGRLKPAALALLVGGSALLTLRGPPDTNAQPVLFRAGMDQAQILSAVAAVDGRVVAFPNAGRLVVLDLPHGAGWRLYRHGALFVGGAGSPAACLNWVTV